MGRQRKKCTQQGALLTRQSPAAAGDPGTQAAPPSCSEESVTVPSSIYCAPSCGPQKLGAELSSLPGSLGSLLGDVPGCCTWVGWGRFVTLVSESPQMLRGLVWVCGASLRLQLTWGSWGREETPPEASSIPLGVQCPHGGALGLAEAPQDMCRDMWEGTLLFGRSGEGKEAWVGMTSTRAA